MKTLVTHNGTFHADEVFAVATFLLANGKEEWQVVRSRDADVIKNADATIDVGEQYDIGNLRFDHHQTGGAGTRENGIPFASFGLVWNIFGEMVAGDQYIKDAVENRLVLPIDAIDNGITLSTNNIDDVSPYAISGIVDDFNITWKEEEDAGEDADKLRYDTFMELVALAMGIINRTIIRARDKYLARDFVIKAYDDAKDKRIIILDRFYPWQDTIITYPEPLFVVYPNVTGTWSAKAVPKEKNSFESRKQFPASWAGKRDEECVSATNVPTASFVHNACFLAIASTKEDAILLAQKAIEN